MKKEAVMFLICILLIQFVIADTTFFEGEVGYKKDFIMGNLPEEVIGEAITPEISPTRGGFAQSKKTIVCEICFDSLSRHINEYRHINYSKEEIEFLRLEIKEDAGIYLSPKQILVLVENFEEECNKSYPLLGGFAGGRYSEILFPFTIIVFFIILISLIILYFLFRKLRKVKSKKKSFKKPRKKKK